MAQGSLHQAAQLSVITGDLKSQISHAMANGKLTDWLVAAASSVSHKLWSEAAEAFAIQLTSGAEAETEDPVKAAGFFLMVNKVKEAVQVLKKCGQFRLAIGIVK